MIVYQFRIHIVALDFNLAYWPAGHHLLEGLSPYAVTSRQIARGSAFVYPALSALLFAPFALISKNVGQVLYMLACIACVPAILRVLNVRDWRLYGLALMWFPVFDGWWSGNVTLPLALMVALVWRHRHRPLVAGLLTAVALSLKPFTWPLGLWLLATRRWRAAACALGCGAVINAAAWALVGFGRIHTYLHLSSVVTETLWRGGYSMLAVAHHLGFGRGVGEGLLLVASALTAAAVIFLGAVRRQERDALALTVVLMLIATPLLWAHYFALLLVPVALCRPRLSPVWVLPLLMWPMPPRVSVSGGDEILAWAVTGAVMLAVLRRTRYRAPARREGIRQASLPGSA